MLNNKIYDIIVIGGGINGTGIAANASQRGLQVLLCEKNDLANATSSASSKLIHGGLRYLEQHEFRLVREALKEREILQSVAKHLIQPLDFILPYHTRLRPRLLIRLGLFLYDHLTWNSSLPKTKTIKLKNHPAGKYLKKEFKHAFQYSDCRTDDSRLVVSNALQAKSYGAEIFTYTECIDAKSIENIWYIKLKDKQSGKIWDEQCRIVINATGPWTENFLANTVKIHSQNKLALVKGSHFIVPKLYEEEFAFIMQNYDGRVVFVIPYLTHFSMIGTTDTFFSGDPSEAKITDEEINYLLQVTNNYFSKPIKKSNIIHTFSGVRPLLQSKTSHPSANTRDYVIEINQNANHPPIVSLFGGKLTTFRKLSEKVVDKLQPFFANIEPLVLSQAILPGADYDNDKNFLIELQNKFPWLEDELLKRYMAQYGTNIYQMLEKTNCIQQLGVNFGANLFQREVDYLVQNEWAKTTDDILWRRTKLGYFFPKENLSELSKYLKSTYK